MSEKQKAILGQLIFLEIGIGMYAYTIFSNFQIRSKNDIGSGGVPKIVCAIIILLTIIKLIIILTDKTISTEKKTNDNVNLPKGFAVMAVLGLYCFLIKPIGFPILTPFMLFAEMSLMAPSEKRNYKLFAILAVVVTMIIFVAFYYGLDLMLPAGIIKKYL